MTAVSRARPNHWWRALHHRWVAFKQGFDAARRELLASGGLVAS